MIQLELTGAEAESLLQALTIALEGMEEAKQEMMEDRATLNNFDDFMEVMQDAQIQADALESVKSKLVDTLVTIEDSELT